MNPADGSAAEAHSSYACCARTRVSTPPFTVRITAQTHFIMLMGFRVLPIIPIVQAKATLPGFGHAQIVLRAQRVWEELARADQFGISAAVVCATAVVAAAIGLGWHIGSRPGGPPISRPTSQVARWDDPLLS